MTPDKREELRWLIAGQIYAAMLGAGAKWDAHGKAIEAAEDLIDGLELTAPTKPLTPRVKK